MEYSAGEEKADFLHDSVLHGKNLYVSNRREGPYYGYHVSYSNITWFSYHKN